MASFWGNKIKIALFGESHSELIGATIDGLQVGIEVDYTNIEYFLENRRPNSDFFGTSRVEKDEYEVISGITNGKTNGSPLTVIMKNSKHNKTNDLIARPSHADYTAYTKYNGYCTISGGGHLSGRLTAPLVVLGAICHQILSQNGIKVFSHIKSVYNINDVSFYDCDDLYSVMNELKGKNPPFISNIKDKVKDLLFRLNQEKTSCGGVIECCILSLPVGVGNPRFDGLDSKIASMMLSIPAVKGVEFGEGFKLANMLGNEAVDNFMLDENAKVKLQSNHNGGMNGGISNGMPVIFSVAVKPTPTINSSVIGLDLKTHTPISLTRNTPTDTCIAIRIAPVVDALTSIVILDLLNT